MKISSIPLFSLIIDSIYQNTLRTDKKSLKQLSKDVGCSLPFLTKIRSILISKQILIVEGSTRNQTVIWHPNKSLPNPLMVQEVYKVYHKESKFQIKSQLKKEKQKSFSLDEVIDFLKKENFSGFFSKTEILGIKSVTTKITF